LFGLFYFVLLGGGLLYGTRGKREMLNFLALLNYLANC